jgi:PEP-CTERM motif-containing protein
MTHRHFLSVALGASLLASPALAQTIVTAGLTSPAAPGGTAIVSPFGYYMSPYSGTVDTTTGLRFNCVDFFHDAFVGKLWTAFETNLGELLSNPSLLAFTRQGSSGLYSQPNALQLYQQVAWLSDQMPANPGQDANTVGLTNAIQTAMWTIADDQPNNAFTNLHQYYGPLYVATNNPFDTQYWIDKAKQEYDDQAPGYYDKFNILTDQKTIENGGGVQEFIFSSPPTYSSTPEPGTLMLFGSGAAGLAMSTIRRRRKEEPDAQTSDGAEASD